MTDPRFTAMMPEPSEVQELIERAFRLEPGADFTVNHEEWVTIMQDADPSFLYLAPPGYEPYLLGRRLVETEPGQ